MKHRMEDDEPETDEMDGHDFAERLKGVLFGGLETEEAFEEVGIARVESFEEAGVLTRDSGVVVTMKDRSEFQVTIVCSRTPRG